LNEEIYGELRFRKTAILERSKKALVESRQAAVIKSGVAGRNPASLLSFRLV